MMKEYKVVVFQLNSELCATNSLEIGEIVKYKNVIDVKDASIDYMIGIYDLRNKYIPVIDLNKKFGMNSTNIEKRTKIIIANVSGEWVGFVVNDVIEIINISNSDIEDVPDILYGKKKDYIKKIVNKDGKLFVIINITSLLTNDELSEINKIRDINSKIQEETLV